MLDWWTDDDGRVAAQNFEYKMSNILDKPLESVFGYITVLLVSLSLNNSTMSGTDMIHIGRALFPRIDISHYSTTRKETVP